MASMEIYVTFVKNNKTGEEFITTRKSFPGDHERVLNAEKKKYAGNHTIHTTYTQKELSDILESIKRWGGDDSGLPQAHPLLLSSA